MNGEDGGGVVVGAGVHVKMEAVVAAADRGDRWAGHRVRREVGGGTLAVVCGSQGICLFIQMIMPPWLSMKSETRGQFIKDHNNFVRSVTFGL